MAGDSFLLLAARTWTHTEPPNVTGEEPVYDPTGDSNRGPLAYRARTQTTELKINTHRRPVTISICLIRFIPYSEPCSNRRDSSFAARRTNMDPHWATKCQRGGKLPIIILPAEDRNRNLLHANPNLHRAAIKAIIPNNVHRPKAVTWAHSNVRPIVTLEVIFEK